MKEDESSICDLVKPVLERVVLALAEKYRISINRLSPIQQRALRALIQESMKDKKLISSVAEHAAKTLGMNESLIEVNLHEVVSHAMTRFIKFTTSQ